LSATARVRGYSLLVGTVLLVAQLPIVSFDDASEPWSTS
jgi:hypothetical protein